MIAQCRLEISWNGKTVMRAECSRNMAYTTLRTLPEGFAGKSHGDAVDALPSLNDIRNGFTGTILKGAFSDKTGGFAYIVEIMPG